MRSIRRSLIGYFVLLLALALGGVGLLVDRFAIAAIEEREQAEARRIEKAYELRRAEAKVKFDAELLAETKALARELQLKLNLLLGQGSGRGPGSGGPGGGPGGGTRPPDGPPRGADPMLSAPEKETQDFRLRMTLLGLAPGAAFWPRAATSLAIDPPPVALARGPGFPRPDPLRPLSPLWLAYDAPRALARIQDAIRKFFEDDDRPGFSQFSLSVTYFGQPPIRSAVIVRSARAEHDLGADLPFDLEAAERNSDLEYVHDDVPNSTHGLLRRVVKVGGRPGLFFSATIAPPAQIVPAKMAPFRYPDMWIRVVVHHARPYTELESRLKEEQQNGDAELAKVREETQHELAQLRSRLGLIGIGSFLAVVLGGWFIVARGLAPIRTLSDAVSRVSEKDFRLPVVREDLSHELMPILARLTKTLDSLRRAFAREKQSVADISHELRTPIASLLATIDVSLRKPRGPDQYRSTLEDCRGIAKQLGQLVERIMTLASLDAGSARTALVRADAAEIARTCATVIRPLAEAHGYAFALDLDGPLPLDTDPDKLREVLMNLLHNAIEYNRPGGRVALAARREGSSIAFEVSDGGIGMPPEVRERIFERFFRADPSRHATGIHAGLGLAIVKEYLDRIGGTLSVESVPDVGSTFRFALPAAVPTSDSDELLPTAEDVRPDRRVRGAATPTGS